MNRFLPALGAASEGQQLPDQIGTPLRAGFDGVEQLFHRLRLHILSQQGGGDHDRREYIVEVVRDSAG